MKKKKKEKMACVIEMNSEEWQWIWKEWIAYCVC